MYTVHFELKKVGYRKINTIVIIVQALYSCIKSDAV